MHPDQPTNLVFLLGTAVDDRCALSERTLIDANVGELPVTTVFELEGEGYERLVGIALERQRSLVV